jgi:preprotein translocase subunit SecA
MAGSGVDILLGGNPEGLAREALYAEGLDPDEPEQADHLTAEIARFQSLCAAEAAEVRRLGGLYVLGSERHESRRIDNQLRGRAGRQGDLGESRFYLSLEDELMRLFATGAMSWVMDRALPDDVPIEARMVTRAIERAQNTVEQKNAEVRKDVLKYDEVMNEQRKVIYERRLQVIDGEDLRETTFELLEGAARRVIADCCPSDYVEEWDLERLVAELGAYYPTKFSVADLEQASSVEQLEESVIAEAVEFYEEREQTIGLEAARELEQHVMREIIDQRWRQHLAEMDHLREGIHLRGIAQTDPLVAWQREGFEMFGHLMEAVDDDYVRFITHLQVVDHEEQVPDLSQATYEAADDPVVTLSGAAATPLAPRPAGGDGAPFAASERPGQVVANGALTNGAVTNRAAGVVPAANGAVGRAAVPSGVGVRPPAEKLGRNEPCWCGSGKKFKLCHGKA